MWFNTITTMLLRSPLHGLISRNVMLFTVNGRKTGRTISTPVNFLRDGNTLWVISWRPRTWWRNLRQGANVLVLLSGKTVQGHGLVIEEEKAVARCLFDYYRKVPHLAKYVHIALDASGQPLLADCELLAQKTVFVKIDLV